MFGMFLGKIPSYGLLTIFAAPIILTPFTLLFQVSIIGQLIMYATVFFVTISTLFLSTLITTAIQAKLGESSRGNDIAKALSMVVAILVLVPMYGLMYFANAMSSALGMDVFLLFPFTWGADLISWSVILFNNVNILPALFNDFFVLNAFGDFTLLICFTGLIVLVAYFTADRIFTFGAGPRTEKITTVGKENFILRGIRRISPDSFGVLVVNMVKEFSRKMQNVSRLVYAVVIATLLPIIMSYSLGSIPEGAPEGFHSFIVFLIVLMLGMMISMVGGVTFGGIGFIESKDQLWIIRSAPNGVWKFSKARTVESFILIIPIAVIPSVISAVAFNFSIIEILATIAYVYWSACGAVLLTTGITANNPAYEDQKSSAFMMNTFASIFILMIILMASLFFGIEYIFGQQNFPLFFLVMSTPVFIIGLVIYIVGVARMARVEVN